VKDSSALCSGCEGCHERHKGGTVFLEATRESHWHRCELDTNSSSFNLKSTDPFLPVSITMMSEFISIGTEDPEYYAELLCKTCRPPNRHLPSDERPCPDVPGITDTLARRLQTVLDAGGLPFLVTTTNTRARKRHVCQ
jgi:hypothetical protein